jgi:hypothetical protein
VAFCDFESGSKLVWNAGSKSVGHYIWRNTGVRYGSSLEQCCGTGAEIKLPTGAGAEIMIAAPAPAPYPAPFYLSKTWRNFIEKFMVAKEFFVLKSKKIFVKVSHKQFYSEPKPKEKFWLRNTALEGHGPPCTWAHNVGVGALQGHGSRVAAQDPGHQVW